MWAYGIWAEVKGSLVTWNVGRNKSAHTGLSGGAVEASVVSGGWGYSRAHAVWGMGRGEGNLM